MRLVTVTSIVTLAVVVLMALACTAAPVEPTTDIDATVQPTSTPPPGEDADNANGGALVDQIQARIDSLEAQLTTRAGEINQLHRLLAQTALNAAPDRPWWKLWK